MTGIEALIIIMSAIVIPYVVALIRGGAISGEKARWIAFALSLAAGILAGLAGGIPESIGAWVMCVFAAVGAVQTFYAMFKKVGITNKWLEALMDIRKDEDDPEAVAKNQSIVDKVEDKVSKEE